MKVKVGNKIYDAEKEPIMIILSDVDKKNIANMNPECTKYCVYPDNLKKEKVSVFMQVDNLPEAEAKVIKKNPKPLPPPPPPPRTIVSEKERTKFQKFFGFKKPKPVTGLKLCDFHCNDKTLISVKEIRPGEYMPYYLEDLSKSEQIEWLKNNYTIKIK